MKDTMNDTDEPIEDDEAVEEDDPRRRSSPPRPISTKPSSPVSRPNRRPADPAVAEVESIQDLLVKQEARGRGGRGRGGRGVVVALTERMSGSSPSRRASSRSSRPSSSARTASWSSTGASWRTRRGCSAATAPEGASLRFRLAPGRARRAGCSCPLAFPPARVVAARVRRPSRRSCGCSARAGGSARCRCSGSRSASASTAPRSTGSCGSGRWRGWRSRSCARLSAVVFGLVAPAVMPARPPAPDGGRARRPVDRDRLAPRDVAARRVHAGGRSGSRRSTTRRRCGSRRSRASGASRSSSWP